MIRSVEPVVGNVFEYGRNFGASHDPAQSSPIFRNITYVLSIPPIIIPFIIKMIKPDLSLKVWNHSYENKETYFSAKRMLETYQEKVTQQDALVNKLTLEQTK